MSINFGLGSSNLQTSNTKKSQNSIQILNHLPVYPINSTQNIHPISPSTNYSEIIESQQSFSSSSTPINTNNNSNDNNNNNHVYIRMDGIMYPITFRKSVDNNGIQLQIREILEFLENYIPDDAFCLIGITLFDLYMEDSDLFVVGWASDNVAIISFARFGSCILVVVIIIICYL